MSELVRVTCPSCNSGFRVAASHLGRSATCPSCGVKFVLQAPGSVTVAAPTSAPARIPTAETGPANPFDDAGDNFASFSAASPRAAASPSPTRPAVATAPKLGGTEWLMIGGGIGLIILALGVVVVLVMNSQKSSTADAGPVDPDRAGLTAVGTVPLVNTNQPTKGERVKLDSAEIFEKHAASVAVVKGKTGSGSGFLLPGNIVATNNHVVMREFIEDVEVEFPDAKERSQKGPFKAELLYESFHRDIAFLKLKEDCTLPPLEIADPVEYKPGVAITFIGSPGSETGVNKNDVRPGTLSGKATNDNVDWYAFQGDVWHGNSGGPVFDHYGRVIGIVTKRDRRNENIKYCIPADEILTHFKQMNYRDDAQKTANGSRHRLRALAERLINAAASYTAFFQGFVNLMREAEKEGQDERQIAEARRRIHETLTKEIGKMLPENLEQIIETVKADSNVPSDVKESFTKLLESYYATRDYFDQIKGVERPSEDDYKQILKKSRELKEQQEQVLKKLMEGLDQVLE